MRLIFYSLFLYGIVLGQGFVHVEDGEIVDGNGDPTITYYFSLDTLVGRLHRAHSGADFWVHRPVHISQGSHVFVGFR